MGTGKLTFVRRRKVHLSIALDPIPIKIEGDRQAPPRARIKEFTTNIRTIVTAKIQGCKSITYSSGTPVSEKTTVPPFMSLFNHQEAIKT